MDAEETVAACHLAARVVVEVSTAVEGVHRGILSRIRSSMALASPDLAASIDVVELPTRAIYGAVRASTVAASHVAATVSSVVVSDGNPPASQTRRGAAILAGISCAVGDQMAEDPRLGALAPQMSVRRNGQAVAPWDVRGVGTRGLAVFLHGLGGTEHQWSPEFEEVLVERGITCAFIRYNTGRSIHANGVALAELLGEIAAGFPVDDMPRVVLVGHSMGGLVIRSALQEASAPIAAAVTDVVSLGSPHRGAPLEKVAAVGLRGLRQFRESSALAEFGNRRAIGIKDLRFGALHPDHWGGMDPDTVLRDTTADVPLPSHVRHHAVVASLGAPGSLKGAVFGDGMVRAKSASGRGDPSHRVSVHHLYETGHMTLLRHPRVAQILAKVADTDPGRAPVDRHLAPTS